MYGHVLCFMAFLYLMSTQCFFSQLFYQFFLFSTSLWTMVIRFRHKVVRLAPCKALFSRGSNSAYFAESENENSLKIGRKMQEKPLLHILNTQQVALARVYTLFETVCMHAYCTHKYDLICYPCLMKSM